MLLVPVLRMVQFNPKIGLLMDVFGGQGPPPRSTTSMSKNANTHEVDAPLPWSTHDIDDAACGQWQHHGAERQ